MEIRRICRSGPALTAALALFFGAATAVAQKREKIPSNQELIPEGEKELTGPHDVAKGRARYRPGKGLEIASSDGEFNLITRLRGQMVATFANESGEPAELGLVVRRARLQFLGHAFGGHNKLKVEIAISPRDLRMTRMDSGAVPRESPLLDWYFDFDYLRDLTVRIGQYKIPFSRQRVISSGNLQMVDRSIANAEFNLDRDIGIDLRSSDLFGLGMLRYYIGIYNGEGRSVFANGDTDLMYLGRIEILPLGMFDDYSEADFQRLERPGASIGVGYAYAPDARGRLVNRDGVPNDGGTTDFHMVTADVMVKYLGFSLQSEIFWREGDRDPGDAVDEMGNPIPTQAPRDGIGWFVQAGVLLPRNKIELSGRYGQIVASEGSSLSDRHDAGVAVSYYFARHPFKLQADAFQLWDDGGFTGGLTRVRAQLQLAF